MDDLGAGVALATQLLRELEKGAATHECDSNSDKELKPNLGAQLLTAAGLDELDRPVNV